MQPHVRRREHAQRGPPPQLPAVQEPGEDREASDSQQGGRAGGRRRRGGRQEQGGDQEAAGKGARAKLGLNEWSYASKMETVKTGYKIYVA